MNRSLVLLLSLATPGLALANTHVAASGHAGSSHVSSSPAPAPAPAPSAGPAEHRTNPGHPGGPPNPGGYHPYRGTRWSGGSGYLVLDHNAYYREGTYSSAFPSRPLPGLALELGLDSRHLAPSGDQLTSDNAVTTQLRLLAGLRHGFYVGLEGEAGHVMSGSMEPIRSAVYGYTALLGVMERSNGLGLGVELAAGGRSYEGTPAAFTVDPSGTSTIGVVEARVRGELALTDTLALGAMVGSSVIDRNDWTAGAYLSMHTRAFGNL